MSDTSEVPLREKPEKVHVGMNVHLIIIVFRVFGYLGS